LTQPLTPEDYLVNHSSKLALLGLSLALTACSSLQSDKVDYKSTGKSKAPALEVPPDLSQLSRDNRYVVPGVAVTATGYQAGQTSQVAAPTAPIAMGDVRIERTGTQRWLVVNRPPEKLWDEVKDFWQDSGFLLTMDQKELGIMETDWAENRAKIPDDFLRNTLGKVLDSLYSTGERDKFRTRLERNSAGGTEIYISHRGMKETYIAERSEDTRWQPRPADPELETEFLRRLMVKLGVSQEQSKALVAADAPKLTSRVATLNGQPVVQIDEGFDRAWRRVGLTLDRTGFTVEDRDRSQGTYFVRYVEPTAAKEEPGFFSKLFSSTPKDKAPQKYRITLVSEGNLTTVSVLNASGAPEASDNAQRIVKVIAADLK
jgi:outer membrane protein assembly factor BamC